MEENKDKCYKYFGESLNSVAVCGPFSITTVSVGSKDLDKDTKVATRIFEVKKGGDTKRIHHIHYGTWPDKVCHPLRRELLDNRFFREFPRLQNRCSVS